MSKKIKLEFTEAQLRTIWEALEMLHTDWGHEPTATGRKVLRNIERVRKTIAKQAVQS